MHYIFLPHKKSEQGKVCRGSTGTQVQAQEAERDVTLHGGVTEPPQVTDGTALLVHQVKRS